MELFSIREGRNRYEFSKFPNFRSPFFNGLTFGLAQYDLSVNWQAVNCLKKCKFKPGEVGELFDPETTKLKRLNKKLSFHRRVIDECDDKHIRMAILRLTNLIKSNSIKLESDHAFLVLLDYHNLFFVNNEGRIIEWMKEINTCNNRLNVSRFHQIQY